MHLAKLLSWNGMQKVVPRVASIAAAADGGARIVCYLRLKLSSHSFNDKSRFCPFAQDSQACLGVELIEPKGAKRNRVKFLGTA